MNRRPSMSGSCWLFTNLFVVVCMTLILTSTRADVIMRADFSSDIEDVVLDLSPNLILNIDTPANTYIGSILVLTYSKQGYKSLQIPEDDAYVKLVDEKLYLKDSGAKLLQDINSIVLTIKVIDMTTPPGKFTKYVRIPVEHNKEDTVLKVTTIDELCENDSNLKIFSLAIVDPKFDPNEPYECRISNTNYPNIDFLIDKSNETTFDVYLPIATSSVSFFDVKNKPILICEVLCFNNFIVTHKRTIDLKICKRINRIKDIILDKNQTEESILLQFDSPVDFLIAQALAVDVPFKGRENYEFNLGQPNQYLWVNTYGSILVRKKLNTSLLKYVYPHLKLNITVRDLTETGREISRRFKFNINETGQKLPFLRFRPQLEIRPMFRFAQENEFFIKIGKFELDPAQFPKDRFDLRLKAGNVSLDDEGNLFIGDDPLKDVKADDQDVTVALNVFDKKENVVVFEDVFDIEIPPIVIPTTVSSTSTTSTRTTSRVPAILECVNDRDCNRKENGANKCLRLSSLKEKNIQDNGEAENLLRRLQFIANKDQSIFLKYNLIQMAIASPDKDLYDALNKFQITVKDLYQIGVCLCDQDSQGFRCQQPLNNLTPHQCHPNSTVPSCTPDMGICQPTEFLLRNTVNRPPDRLVEYRSYYCECTKNGTVGVNCEFRRNPCTSLTRRRRQEAPPFMSDPVRRYAASNLGPVDARSTKCNPDELCVPNVNDDGYRCLKKPSDKQQEPVNYLVFDDKSIKDDDKFKRLNLTDASVITGLQNFIKDEVMPRYSYNDYAKIPKGPLAIMRPSIDMPDVLNGVRKKVNDLISSNDKRADMVLEQLSNNRIQQLVQDTLLYLITNNKLNNMIIDDVKKTVDMLISKLNVSDMKNFSTPLWNLKVANFPPNLTANGQDPTGLVRHLAALKNNSDKLNNVELLSDVLSLNSDNKEYIDIFNFSNRPYGLLKLDILPGIYVDSDNELSVRPTPGIFLESLPNDPTSPNRELIFLPGIFNPASSPKCDLKSLFMPGIMSLPIDNYDLAHLPNDANRYLNKFIPMQIPFNINGFLTPLRSSSSDTISSLLLQQNDKQGTFRSHLLLTPIDTNTDTTFDIITKNEKFMSNLFSNESLYRVVREQKQLDVQNLASTQVLSNPTMLPLNKQTSLNSECIDPTGFKPKYNAKGIQTYSPTKPTDGVTVLPFVLYDADGNPIPQSVVNDAIKKYCANYQVQINEFHARVCNAQNKTNEIMKAQNDNPALCAPDCSFTKLADAYYNPNGRRKSKKKKDYWWLLLLSSLLALLWLLWLLSLLCCCLRWCPLAALFKRKRHREPRYVIKNKSSKIFGDKVINKPTMDYLHIYMANGELARSSVINRVNSVFKYPVSYTMNSRDKVFGNDYPLAMATAPSASTSSLAPPNYEETLRANAKKLSILTDQTGTSVQIRQPKRFSTIISSSIVNDNGPANVNTNISDWSKRKSIVISSHVKGRAFMENDSMKNKTFVTKRIPRERAFSLDTGAHVDKPPVIPVSILKSSPSYPFIDQLNFYRNDAFIRNLRASSIDLDRSASPPVNAMAEKNPNNFFRLKRLSNYIINDPNEKTGYELSTGKLEPSRVGGRNLDVFLFKLHRIENESLGGNEPNSYRMMENMNLTTSGRDKEEQTNAFVIDWLLKNAANETENAHDYEQIESSVQKPRDDITVTRMIDQTAAPGPYKFVDGLKSFFKSGDAMNPEEDEKITCFVCNKPFVNKSTGSQERPDFHDSEDGMYICDVCYSGWYSTAADASFDMKKAPATADNDYLYFIVRKKKSRHNSENNDEDAIDVLNLDESGNSLAPELISKHSKSDLPVIDSKTLKKSINEIFDAEKKSKNSTIYSLTKDNKLLNAATFNNKNSNNLELF